LKDRKGEGRNEIDKLFLIDEVLDRRLLPNVLSAASMLQYATPVIGLCDVFAYLLFSGLPVITAGLYSAVRASLKSESDG